MSNTAKLTVVIEAADPIKDEREIALEVLEALQSWSKSSENGLTGGIRNDSYTMNISVYFHREGWDGELLQDVVSRDLA